MFRMFFALFLVFILRSFASQNKSTNNQTQCGKGFFKNCNCRDGRDGRDGQNGKDGRDGRDAICGVKGGRGKHGNQGIAGKNGEKGDKGERGSQGIAGKNGTKGDKGERGSQGIAGKNSTKGQKGERGSPGKKPDGAIQFSDTADKCIPRIAGTVRYNASQKALLLCDGSAWLLLFAAGKGFLASKPGRHCLDILNSGQSRGNGLYWIDPNGGSTDDSFQAFCDMETERGGWTLVATKVSPSFLVIRPEFSRVAAKTKHSDAASHIHPSMGDWGEAMFRFADVSTIRVIYNRKAGAPNTAKKEFDKFLMGKFSRLTNNVLGFYKYSPADRKRSPARGFATINALQLYSKDGISEHHRGSDKWLDMWYGTDRQGNNYIYSDSRRARGTKCIAGYCYLNKPIWVMVR